jgi:hypothetical protein
MPSDKTTEAYDAYCTAIDKLRALDQQEMRDAAIMIWDARRHRPPIYATVADAIVPWLRGMATWGGPSIPYGFSPATRGVIREGDYTWTSHRGWAPAGPNEIGFPIEDTPLVARPEPCWTDNDPVN